MMWLPYFRALHQTPEERMETSGIAVANLERDHCRDVPAHYLLTGDGKWASQSPDLVADGNIDESQDRRILPARQRWRPPSLVLSVTEIPELTHIRRRSRFHFRCCGRRRRAKALAVERGCKSSMRTRSTVSRSASRAMRMRTPRSTYASCPRSRRSVGTVNRFQVPMNLANSASLCKRSTDGDRCASVLYSGNPMNLEMRQTVGFPRSPSYSKSWAGGMLSGCDARPQDLMVSM
ncbi:hypothetical protein C8R43DRAFT_603051 [Mycena crocata]|nr:hypothetical protein C8R43DRAFT_603051 [Mycena crocata]